jgi:molybdopterin-biosynthesis enzyme MoeA-like protein
MADWVLERLYTPASKHLQEASLLVLATPESALVPLMESFAGRFPDLKLYSLPQLGEEPKIELGLRGRGDIATGIRALIEALERAGIPYQQPE